MRATFHIFYNGESCKDVGLSVISRPTIPVPEREYDTIKVEGRDGELHRDIRQWRNNLRSKRKPGNGRSDRAAKHRYEVRNMLQRSE